MLRIASALLLAVSAHAATNTGHYRGWYAFDITAGGAHTISVTGMSCKNAYVDMLVMGPFASTYDPEDASSTLEDSAKHFLSFEYPGNSTGGTTANSYTAAGGIQGDCVKRILKQDTITQNPINMGSIPDCIDTTTKPFLLQVQFASDDFETCTNVAGAAAGGDGHAHRRSGGFTFQVTFPGSAVGKRYFFFSDNDLASYEFSLTPPSGSAYAVAAKEVSEDPNKCSEATEATKSCGCDDEKYMWSGIILFVGLLGMAPIVFKQLASGSEKMNMFMSLFNCFGGGCLLSVAVTHVFPEALELYPAKDSGDYPAAAMLCAGGYWLLLMVDKVLLSLCAPEPHADHDDEKAAESKTDSENPDGPNPIIELSSKSAPPQGHGVGIGCDDDHNPTAGNIWHVMGVFLAMALHSALAGIAVGLKTDKSNLENLCIAIVCHKAFDVTTVGILMVRANAPLMQSLPTVAFVALMTPLGIWIGIAGESMDAKLNGSLQAIGSGTFLYVAIQEVLATEFAKPGFLVAKGFAVLGGIAVIAFASIANTNGGHTH